MDAATRATCPTLLERAGRRLTLAFLLSLVVAGPAAADAWYQHYEKAEKALREEDWQEAIAQLQAALERRGDSGARVRTYGMRTVDYFPYLDLALAYRGLGELDAALGALETEERLGEVQQSEEAWATLQQLRGDVEDARRKAATAEQDRIDTILAESLGKARALRSAGDLEAAIDALGKGIAVAPEDPEAVALMDRLHGEFRDRQRRLDDERRAADLLEEGRHELDAGRLNEAARLLQQALTLRPADDEIESLLSDVRGRLSERLQASAVEERARIVTEGRAAAERLAEAGRLEEALERLQPVVAVAPDDPAVRDLQQRLLDRQRQVQQEEALRAAVSDRVAEARGFMDARRFEEALSAANRILALDPGNSSGLELASRAYREINRQLLGRAGNIPPAIRFADLREWEHEGVIVQRTTTPAFRLNGVVIDSTEVEIEFFDAGGHTVEASTSGQPLGDLYLTEFALRRELAPGLSTFRLVATDAEELSSSSEYSVFYARPLYRSPAFLVVMAVSLAALAGGGVGVRVARRAAGRRRRFNPYIAGAPVLNEELFFGRERLLERILQTVHNNSLLLHGERRIGKTSLQHHIKRRLERLEDPDYVFYPVYIDLQGVPEEAFFGTLADDILDELRPHLSGLQRTIRGERGDGYTHRDFAADLRAVLKALEARSSKQVRLVLLIDEVDELNDFDPRINQRLRSLFMKTFAENLVAVVSGVEIKRRWQRRASPWYNFFEEVEVSPLEAKDARQLIERPIGGVLEVEEGVADRIVALTQGRPYPIQRLCLALVNRAYELGKRSIGIEDVDAVVDSMKGSASAGSPDAA